MDSVRNKWVKLSDKDGYKRKNSKAGDPGMIYRMQVRGKAGTGKTYHTRTSNLSLRITRRVWLTLNAALADATFRKRALLVGSTGVAAAQIP